MIGTMWLMFTSHPNASLLALSLSLLVVAILVRDPRLMLQNYPENEGAAGRRSAAERETTVWSAAFLDPSGDEVEGRAMKSSGGV